MNNNSVVNMIICDIKIWVCDKTLKLKCGAVIVLVFDIIFLRYR